MKLSTFSDLKHLKSSTQVPSRMKSFLEAAGLTIAGALSFVVVYMFLVVAMSLDELIR